MKAALCLLTLCLAGYVSSTQYAWKVGKQYTYAVQARLFSGVAIETQYAGLQVQYKITLTVTGPNKIHLNPSDFKAVELNSHMKQGWRDGELENETPAEISPELQKILEEPFELNMREGIVESIVVPSHLPTWGVNIKKAQASNYVVDSTGVKTVLSGNLNRQTNSVRPDEANQESGFFYETMEETVHGECETYYTISQNGPFDWPFQFQKQKQPGQQSQESQEQDNQSQNNSGENQQNNADSQQNEEDSSEEHQQLHKQFATYKQLVQRVDSESAEDSHESFQGELPWPKAFASFCDRQDQVYEIIKSVNFTACKQKPVLAYSTSNGLYGRAGDNTVGASLTRALITRYLACGKDRKQFTILKVEQEEQVNYGLRLDQNTVAGTIQNLTLLSVTNAERVEAIRNSKTINDLTYTFDPKEQQLQSQGKLQHAYFDIMEENENSEEDQERSPIQQSNQQQSSRRGDSNEGRSDEGNDDESDRPTYSQSEVRQRQSQHYRQSQQDRQSQSQQRRRRPRSVSVDQNSQEDSRQSPDSQESDEKPYSTDAEGHEFLRQPTLDYPPVNPMLVSPLQSSGMLKRIVALMQEIVQDILNDKEAMAEAETLSKISTVVRIIRYCKSSEILDVYHQVASKSHTEEDQIFRNVYLDAVAIAGTNPAIVTLINLIKNADITGERAAQLVMTFPLYVRTPTKQLLRAIFSLVESTVVKSDIQLRTTSVLALSNLLHQAYVNLRIKNSRYPVAQYGEFGNVQDVVRDYVPYFQKNLEEYWPKEDTEGNNAHWTVTYLQAFGNLGVREIVPQVQRILDDSQSAYIKTNAILALHRVIVSRSTQNIPLNEIHGVDRNGQDSLTDEVVEKEVMPVLVSVAFDRGEHPEVRMAAISLLLYTTNADVTIWQQLALSTWFAASQEVHSFIYSSLKSLAYLDQNVPSVQYHMQKKARAVLALAKPITPGYAKSRNSFSAGIAEHLQSTYSHQFSYFGSKDSNVPNFMYYKNIVQYGAKAVSVSPLQFQIHGHTIQKLASYALSLYQKNHKYDQANHKDLDQIYQILGIERREQNDDVEGVLKIKIRDEIERLWSVNEDVLENLVKKGREFGVPKLMNGVPINYQKIVHAAETVIEMPSAFGTPITFNYRMPVFLQVRGNVKLVEENTFKDIQLQAEIHPIYAFKTHAKVSFKVPFTGKKYQAGVQRHFVIEAPFRALVRKSQEGQVVVAFTPTQLNQGAPSGPIPLFTFHQKPYTAIITDSLWPTTHKEGGQMSIVHVTRTPFKRELEFGQKALGFAFKSEEISEYYEQNERSSGWIKFWQRFHSQACFFQLGWLGGRQVRYAERRITLDIANSETKTIAFVIAGKYQESASSKDLWQDSSSQSSQSSEESASSESQQNSSSQQEQDNSREQDNESSQGRRHDSNSESGATHSSEDMSQNGWIVSAAIIGKRTPIRPVANGRGTIQKILQKGSPSTIQYLVQLSKSSGRFYVRAAIGDAANEAAKVLPQSSKSLQALREAIVASPNSKTQPDYCVEFEGEYDAPKWANRGELLVLRKRLLSDELSVNVKAEIQFGQTCSNMPHEIKVQGKLQRGPKMTEWAQTRSRQAQKCAEDEKKGFNVSPVCIWVAEHQAAALNKGDLKITFTDMPKPFVNRTDDVEDFVKAFLYPYVSTDRFHQGAGDKKIRVEYNLTPNKQFLDVHITKPNSKLSFQGVRTNRFIQALLPLTATQSLGNNIRDRTLRADSDPSCQLESNYINTFDNVTYRFSEKSAQNCYHVLAQDCSGRHPVSVLVRDITEQQKKVVILLSARTKIELSPRQGSQQQQRLLGNAKLQVDINGQRVESLPRVIRSKDSGRVIARIEQMNEGGIQVFTQHLDVATNSKYVVIFASNQLRNRTCGLCGDFNGEKVGDMKSPKNCPLSSGSALVASYALKPQALGSSEKGLCQIDQELKRQIKNEEEQCLQDPTYNPSSPSRFPGAKYDLELKGDCIDEAVTVIREAVFKAAKTSLKLAFPFSSSKRAEYANKLADNIGSKVKTYMGEGSADKIAAAITSAFCSSMKIVPVGGGVLKLVCKAASPLLKKGILLAVNPICKKTNCCKPTLRSFEPAEYEQAIDFQFNEEPQSVSDESSIAYLTASEASKPCNYQLQAVMSRGGGHMVHALLQDNLHMSERQRQHQANKARDEVEEALKSVLRKKVGNIENTVVEALNRSMPQGSSPAYESLFTQFARIVLDEMCANRKCCFPGHGHQ